MSVLRARRGHAALLLLAAAACSKSAQNPAPPNPPPALSFDFGVIPHGKARDHEFVLDTRKVLGELGYSATEIDKLLATGVAFTEIRK